MKVPELKWRVPPDAVKGINDLDMLVAPVVPQLGQPCNTCPTESTKDDVTAGWGAIVEASKNDAGGFSFSIEMLCPACLDRHLVHHNRVDECRLEGVRDPGECAEKKGVVEGDHEHKKGDS